MNLVFSVALAWLLFACLEPAAAQTTWPGCSDSVPAPAAAFGYNTEIFCDYFPAGLPEIDVNNVCGTSGCPSNPYSWMALSGWPGLAQGGANAFWCCTQINSASWFSNYSGGGGSGLTYQPASPGFSLLNGGNSGAMFLSCATNGVANQWYGIAIPSAAFVRWETYTLPVSGTTGTPTIATLWQFPIEYLAAPSSSTQQFAELDNSDGGVFKWFLWQSGGTSSFGGGNIAGITTGSGGQVISSLVVKTVDNGGTGLLRGYQTSSYTQVGSDVTWSLPYAAGGNGLLEGQHNCLLVQAPITAAAMNIKSVQVFSKYPLVMGVAPSPQGGRLRKFQW